VCRPEHLSFCHPERLLLSPRTPSLFVAPNTFPFGRPERPPFSCRPERSLSCRPERSEGSPFSLSPRTSSFYRPERPPSVVPHASFCCPECPPFCRRKFRLISLTLKPSYNIQDMRRERRKDSPNAVSLVLRDRSGCFGLSFPFLNLNQNIRLKSLHHNHDDRLQEALSCQVLKFYMSLLF
jgi:hypothetical protein